MEHDDRAPVVATFFSDTPVAVGREVPLGDDAAHHARVKRLVVGDSVRLTTGRGQVGLGALTSLSKSGAGVTIERVMEVAAPPAIHLRVPIGDRDRMLWLAEKATELGIASWQAVRFRRSVSVSPRGEGPAFAAKVRARMVAALEQSGGAWLPVLLPDVAVDQVTPGGARGILLDAAGAPVLEVAGSGACALIFGPEGGLEADERDALIQAGWSAARLAATTLRFETAGIAAIAVARAAQLPGDT